MNYLIYFFYSLLVPYACGMITGLIGIGIIVALRQFGVNSTESDYFVMGMFATAGIAMFLTIDDWAKNESFSKS